MPKQSLRLAYTRWHRRDEGILKVFKSKLLRALKIIISALNWVQKQSGSQDNIARNQGDTSPLGSPGGNHGSHILHFEISSL